MRLHSRNLAAMLVAVASAVFLATTFTVSESGDLISELCNKTSYVETCIAAVKENLKGEITGVAILNAQIDAATKGTKVGLVRVGNLIKSASKREKHILSICKESFQLSAVRLRNAKKAVEERNNTAINVNLNTMVIHVYTCDDSYTKASIPSPLLEVTRQLVHLGSNCFVIADWIGLGTGG